MIKHHPDNNLLTEFASGTLEPALAIAVKTHLHYCNHCQQSIKRLEDVGGLMLEMLEPAEVDDICFDSLMKKITTHNAEEPKAKSANVANVSPICNDTPPVVHQLMSTQTLKWKRSGGLLQSACLPAGEPGYVVSLYRLSAGARAPEHDHCGVEMTVILEGSFSDEHGIYQKGDFVVMEPGVSHKPVAASNEDCLCLTVMGGPVRFNGVFSRLLNPFLRLNTA